MLSRVRSWGLAAAGLIAAALAMPASAPAAQRTYLSDYNATNSVVAGFGLAADGGIGSALPGSPVPTGSAGVEGLAITPDGRALYAVGGLGSSGGVFGYAIGANGTLTPTGTSAVNGHPYGVVSSPDGRFVYATDNSLGGSVHAYSRGADGTPTPVPSSIPSPVSPSGLAIPPDGRHLYVVDSGTNLVLTYAIAADGSLSTMPGTTVPAGDSAYAIALNPNGRFLYVASYDVPGSELRTYTIAPDGSLSAVGTVVPTGGDGAFGMTVTPDGRHLYVANYDSRSIGAFAIGADGLPAPLAGSPVSLADAPGAVAVNAAGDRLYVPDGSGPGTFVFSLGSSGLPAPLAGSPFPTGASGDFQSIALTPDQAPTAAFTTKVNNKRITFDAMGSSDPDGTVSTYAWDFGDGGTMADGGPSPTHKYLGPKGPVTLTVSDESGCSIDYVSAGGTPYCNGSAGARLTATPFQAKLLKGSRSQKLGRTVKLRLRCPAACQVKVVGRVKLTGGRVKIARLRSARKRALPAGKARTLKLKFTRKGRRDSKRAKKAAARLKVTARDDAGDQFKLKRSIKLR